MKLFIQIIIFGIIVFYLVPFIDSPITRGPTIQFHTEQPGDSSLIIYNGKAILRRYGLKDSILSTEEALRRIKKYRHDKAFKEVMRLI